MRYQFSDTVRWTRARISFTFGGEYGRGADDVTNNFRANGRFTFNGGSAPFTGDSFADFLIGKFASIHAGRGRISQYPFQPVRHRSWMTRGRCRPRFTLNLGVRWEPYFPYTDVNNRWPPGTPASNRSVT